MEPRVFYYSKGAAIFYFVALLLMAGISLYALLSTDIVVGKRVFAGILLPIFIYLSFRVFKGSVRLAIKRTPALLMDEKGLYVESEGIVISWDNIEKVKMDFIPRQGDQIYIYLKGKNAISGNEATNAGVGPINISPFDYARGHAIFDSLKAFCGEYCTNPSAVIFTRPTPETWPSEG